MGISDLENLEVYQLANGIAGCIWELVTTWNQFEKESLGNELVHAVDDIGASIAEGCGKEGYLDNIRCIYKAIGSFSKTEHWLKLGCQRRLINEATEKQLGPLMDELGRRLYAHLDSIGKQKRGLSPSQSIFNTGKSCAN